MFFSYSFGLFVTLEKHSCKIDLVICLGGDGTLIHTASIFQKNCPPVLSFSLGSLGFLTPFRFEHHDKVLDDVLSGNVAVLLRTRLNSEIIFDENQNSTNNEKNVNFLALNEVVIDRGVHPYLSNLDIYINDTFITKVQGDGQKENIENFLFVKRFDYFLRFDNIDSDRINGLRNGRLKISFSFRQRSKSVFSLQPELRWSIRMF